MLSNLAACTRCGGTAREELHLGDRSAGLCYSCANELRPILNAFMCRQSLVPESVTELVYEDGGSATDEQPCGEAMVF